MTVSVLGKRLPASATYATLLGAGLLLLLLTVVAAFWQADRQTAHNDAVRRSFEVRADLRRVLIAAQDAETGQRGYLLTRDDGYLEPFESARRRATEALVGLRDREDASASLSAAVADLDAVLTAKFSELDQTVALYRAGNTGEAVAIVQSDRGRELMDQVRAIIDAAVDAEGRALQAHLQEAEQASAVLRLIVLLAALLLIGISWLLIITVRAAMSELRASRDQLVREISGRHAAEAKIVQMQKMEAIGQLTGGVAHDFNNMLAVIISALSLMQRKLERGEHDVTRYLEAAQDGARRAATLTNRLLAFARRQPLTPKILDVNNLVSSMSELLRRTLGETVQMEAVLAGGLWPVSADASQLENAIVNICVNARDAMPDGGKLTIETANAYLDDAYAGANADVSAGQYVLIAMTDTGAGMPADVVHRVFEPFFTTKEVGKGTGLGLSHVHGFLKQSGGHVAIYSEVGHGTTVKLYLPRSHKAVEAAEAEPAPAAAVRGDPETVILVVEDEERVRAMAVAGLRELGYTVVHAESGARALEKLEAFPAVKLLFTDIVMPDMSGRKLADAAKAKFPSLRVLYTTGYTQNAIVHNGVVDSDARLLMKPYGLEDLARKVRAVLDE